MLTGQILTEMFLMKKKKRVIRPVQVTRREHQVYHTKLRLGYFMSPHYK